ncbi:unnamed protein product [Rotaria sp. Silwood1]|nr:unnamed protein product [Rotaria sp. Silwood1]CAF1597559.1 unnamed protein product [Rotaria sp. Silwood1]CAF3702927.1 unnamed protein product [Rotaria sp. Silwood1]CAF4775613.1 unnamed protein product [Rotaria sp. Silwood1]
MKYDLVFHLVHTACKRSTGNTLVELHQFFEDDPNDYQLEMEAEIRLKALYSCLVNATSRTMLQIGLSGLLTYLKASQRSPIIDELLLSKDYISEIITIAADHFTTAPLLSATCLYECMLHYPKKFSPFLINKFRPLLPRIIYKKMSGPSEICCKCIAHLSVLGIPSTAKQAKSWKNEYDRYLKIASLLIDQLYSGINDSLCSDVTDFETTLTAEIGDVISSTDYAAIFSNCCHILKYLFYVQLDSSVAVTCERTFKLISKVVSINSQQFNTLHRKQHLPTLLGSCVQLCDTLVTFNASSFAFNIRSIFTLFISLLDIVRPQAEYLTLSINIYQLLTNLLALFQRQVRIDVDILQKLIRWIINDSTLRTRSKIPIAYLSRPDHNLSRIVINCSQQLLNMYSDHMPKDQYNLIQNHFIQTLMICQSTNNSINKPYDDEICRVGLYNILECLLINERADCSTIIAISKDLIDNANLLDPSVKVKMVIRKLKLVWQQVHDSTSRLYQPWSFLNVDKPRKIPPNNINYSTTNELRNVFVPSTMPIMNNIETSSISMMNIEQPLLMNPQSLSKPSVHQTPMETTTTTTNVFLQPATSMSYPTIDVLPQTQPMNLETFIPPVKEHHKEEYNQISEQKQKRPKLVDTRPVEIDDDEEEDGAEHIFADESDEEEEEHENDHMDEYDEEEEISEEMDESDEVDDNESNDDDGRSDISSDDDDDDENLLHTNGIKKSNQNLSVHQSNVDLIGIDGSPSDSYLQTMNDNLHKKFRRHNHFDHRYSSLHPISGDFSHNNNNQIYHLNQLNGDYKNNINKPTVGNGQVLTKNDNNNNNNDDDDDDIVLVSDDDSEDKKPETKTNSM